MVIQTGCACRRPTDMSHKHTTIKQHVFFFSEQHDHETSLYFQNNTTTKQQSFSFLWAFLVQSGLKTMALFLPRDINYQTRQRRSWCCGLVCVWCTACRHTAPALHSSTASIGLHPPYAFGCLGAQFHTNLPFLPRTCS